MIHAILRLALFGLALHTPAASPAQTALRPLPPLLRAVSDEVGVLTVSEGKTLSRTLADMEAAASLKIIVLIAETTQPESIEAYTQRLVNHWQSRTTALEKGRFVFVVVSQAERTLFIVPGPKFAGVRKPLADSGVMKEAQALLKQDRYFRALMEIVKQLSRLIAGPANVVLQEWNAPGTHDRTAMAGRCVCRVTKV